MLLEFTFISYEIYKHIRQIFHLSLDVGHLHVQNTILFRKEIVQILFKMTMVFEVHFFYNIYSYKHALKEIIDSQQRCYFNYRIYVNISTNTSRNTL